jgi:hypothetical protein
MSQGLLPWSSWNKSAVVLQSSLLYACQLACMYFVFADDAKQDRPSREKMGPLVAAGAILVNGDRLKDLETAIEALCFELPADPLRQLSTCSLMAS